jgi:hypothetical protein
MIIHDENVNNQMDFELNRMSKESNGMTNNLGHMVVTSFMKWNLP